MYHEKRQAGKRIKNYLVVNQRKGKLFIKESEFIGYGKISSEEIIKKKKEFALKLIAFREYPYLSKEQVLEIEKLRQAYQDKIAKLSQEEFEKFQESFCVELTYNSNAIEGSSLSLEETSLVINDNLSPEGKTLREINEARNHAEAVHFLTKYVGEINEIFILKLHSIILENISERFAGRYRESQVRIFGSEVKFPDSSKVPQLIQNLLYWYNQNKKLLHPFELAVIFSIKFVSIHPFVDGNGRISRLLMNYILKKRNYPWINVYLRQRAEYLKAVRQGNDEEYALILEFLIKTLRENLKSYGFLE